MVTYDAGSAGGAAERVVHEGEELGGCQGLGEVGVEPRLFAPAFVLGGAPARQGDQGAPGGVGSARKERATS